MIENLKSASKLHFTLDFFVLGMDIRMQSKNKLSKNHRLWAKLIQTLTFSTKAQFRLDVPEDRLPPIDDWITTFTSILLGGLDLGREPLDISVGSSNLSTNNSLYHMTNGSIHNSQLASLFLRYIVTREILILVFHGFFHHVLTLALPGRFQTYRSLG